MLIHLAILVASSLLIAGGGWLTLAGAVTVVFPDALGLDELLADYRAGAIVARHLSEIALLVALIGVLTFLGGAWLGAWGIA